MACSKSTVLTKFNTVTMYKIVCGRLLFFLAPVQVLEFLQMSQGTGEYKKNLLRCLQLLWNTHNFLSQHQWYSTAVGRKLVEEYNYFYSSHYDSTKCFFFKRDGILSTKWVRVTSGAKTHSCLSNMMETQGCQKMSSQRLKSKAADRFGEYLIRNHWLYYCNRNECENEKNNKHSGVSCI